MSTLYGKNIYTMILDDFAKNEQPDYYAKQRYGKYTIYNKEGWRVAWGLNKKEMENYMKLLKEEK